MARSRGLLRVVTALVFATAVSRRAPALLANGGGAPEQRTDPALTLGIQSADGPGGELAVLLLTRDVATWSGPGLDARGWGVVAGATSGSGYLEAEGVLVSGWRLAGARGGGPLSLVLTGGGGPVVRWGDGAVGGQATLSATVLAVPVMLFVRPRAFVTGARDVVAGFMFKLPLMAPD